MKKPTKKTLVHQTGYEVDTYNNGKKIYYPYIIFDNKLIGGTDVGSSKKYVQLYNMYPDRCNVQEPCKSIKECKDVIEKVIEWQLRHSLERYYSTIKSTQVYVF